MKLRRAIINGLAWEPSKLPGIGRVPLAWHVLRGRSLIYGVEFQTDHIRLINTHKLKVSGGRFSYTPRRPLLSLGGNTHGSSIDGVFFDGSGR